MRNVSSNWEDIQESLLLQETQIKAFIFPIDTSLAPTTFDNTDATYVFCTCLELFAFTNLDSDGFSKVKFYIPPQTLDLDNAIYEFEGDGMPLLSFYDIQDNLLLQSYIDDLRGTLNGVARIDFESFSGSYSSVKYLAFNYVEIEKSDIKSLDYKAHCDALNEILPYHKVFLSTLRKSFTLDERKKTIAYFKVGYDDEYIPIGCGYYYLDKNSYSNDGFVQNYTFVDILSTFTQKNVMNNQNNNSFKNYVKSLANQTSSYVDFHIYNIDTINLSSSSQMNGYRSSAYEHTIAETLQLVAQASGLTLYVDTDNVIRFLNTTATSTIADTNDKWLLDKPQVSQDEIVKTLVINACKCETIRGQGTNDISLAQFTSVSGQNEYVVNIDGIYTGISISSGTVMYSSQNYLVIRQNTPNTTVSITAGYEWGSPKPKSSQVYSVDSEGTAEVVVNLELAYSPDYTTLSSFYKYWLSRPYRNSITTRFDSKYYVLDKIYSVYKEYGKFIIEDIDVGYANGVSGVIKGKVISPILLPPIITKVTTTYLEVINPNGLDVYINFYNGSSQMGNQYMQPFETKQIAYTSIPDLLTNYNAWVGNHFTIEDETYCYFEPYNTLELDDSKDVKVFGGK